MCLSDNRHCTMTMFFTTGTSSSVISSFSSIFFAAHSSARVVNARGDSVYQEATYQFFSFVSSGNVSFEVRS